MDVNCSIGFSPNNMVFNVMNNPHQEMRKTSSENNNDGDSRKKPSKRSSSEDN